MCWRVFGEFIHINIQNVAVLGALKSYQGHKSDSEALEKDFNSYISKNIFKGATCEAFLLNKDWRASFFLHCIKCVNALAVFW